MTENKIVQFVCFTSHLEPGAFIEVWEPYARLLVKNPAEILLQEGIDEKNNHRFIYVSQHTSNAGDFSFAFIKGKSRAHFPEHKARIKLAGGYLPVKAASPSALSKSDVKVMAFIPSNDTALDFYKGLSCNHLNIYEAYFESCSYSYVLEFYLHKQDAPALLSQLHSRPGTEAAVYKACHIPKASKKVSSSLL